MTTATPSPPTSPAPELSRGSIWLKALLLLPLVLGGVVAIKDQLLPLDIQVLSGGASFLILLLLRVLAYLALVSYGTSGFWLYFLLILQPFARLSRLRRQLLALFLLNLCSFGMVWAINQFMASQLGQAALAPEDIAPASWQVESCARGTGICLHWTGRWGEGTVKQELGSRDQAQAQMARWNTVRMEEQGLNVIWGPTPLGWIGVQSASAGTLQLHNPWPARGN